MAHKKGGGTKATQGGNVSGKRLGIKIYGGSAVKCGQIISRQRGREIIPGKNVEMGKDFTLYSTVNGTVQFVFVTKNRKKVNVVEKAVEKKVEKEAKKETEKKSEK